MFRFIRQIVHTLSIRLTLMVVFAMDVLLIASLCIMFRHSRRALHDEAMHKAAQTLENTIQNIDNILLSIELASGNMYWNIVEQLDRPDRMFDLSRRFVESNPYVTGCAIAFEPYFYKEKGKYFMAYSRRSPQSELTTSRDTIIQAKTFGNRPYLEQVWYTTPTQSGNPCWTDALKGDEAEGGAITSFCLPLRNRQGHIVGVIAVDLSLKLLSEIMLDAKPSPNSYCTLLDRDGAFIVHPDSNKLFHHTVMSQPLYNENSTVKEAAQAMLNGKTGYRRITIDDTNSYLFFKPFLRKAMTNRWIDDKQWSVGIVYPEDDIFRDYNLLLTLVIVIATIGLLMMFPLCLWFTRRQLHPLKVLTQSARRIAGGHYNESVPDSRQNDEIGRLQRHFQQMQRSLANHIDKLRQLTDTLQERGKVLDSAYQQARQADRMKTAFLHHMTDQMIAPVQAMEASVTMLENHYKELPPEQVAPIVNDIQQQGNTVAQLLQELLHASQKTSDEHAATDNNAPTGKEGTA